MPAPLVSDVVTIGISLTKKMNDGSCISHHDPVRQ